MATASLVLGGTAASGCGDDGASPASVAGRVCRIFEQCYPVEFAHYYDTLAYCREELEEDFEYYAEQYGRDCTDAILAYYECFSDKYPGACADYYGYEACPDEEDRTYEACGPR